MKLSQKQIESVLALPAPKRYQHFVKVVVDWEEAWGLYQAGWALAGSDDGETVFPLWPARDYATLCSRGEWEGYEPAEISLSDLLNELLPKLDNDKVFPGVFYTPADKGVVVTAEVLKTDLEEETKKYL